MRQAEATREDDPSFISGVIDVRCSSSENESMAQQSDFQSCFVDSFQITRNVDDRYRRVLRDPLRVLGNL